MDWRQATDYAFAPRLDAAGWAWQFLRRNPEYRADYRWFIATWQHLEADYGVPPLRDFFRWKQDPRAWRAESEIACGAEICPGEGDRILIECWMGARWGFRKFPVDPAIDFPEDLTWREQPGAVIPLAPGEAAPGDETGTTLTFDLALPLDLQLEAARRHLAAARHKLAQRGRAPALNLRQGAPRWQTCLRLLDGLEAGAPLADIGAILDLADPETAAKEAGAILARGYLRILRLPD